MGLFRKPSAKKLGLKVLVMGEKGVGKSVFTLSFPKVYAMDAETGMAFYENHPVFGKNLEAIANTQDFNELQEAIEELMELEEGTLVIDSETKFYQNLTDASLKVEEAKARNNGKNVDDSAVSMRGWGRIKSVAQRLQNLKIDLSAKGVNVISVSQIDDVKQKVGDNFVKIGEKPVMQKGSEYDYDIVLKLYTEMDANKNVSYKGLVLKDRTGVTKVGQVVSDPSYDTWRLFLESRDGADKIQSTLSKDLNKSQKALKEEDAELEKTLTDKFRELVAKSEEHKAKLVGLVQKAGIENPLSPKANELKKLEEIIELVSAI
jgi:septin family protein